MVKVYSFYDFIDLPVRTLRCIGKNLYEHRSEDSFWRRLAPIYMYAGFFNFNLLLAGELLYVLLVLGNRSQTLEVTAAASCMTFALVVDAKLMVLVVNNRSLLAIINEVEALFPSGVALQRLYDVGKRQRSMRRIMLMILSLSMAHTTTYCIYPAVRSSIMYLFAGSERFERAFTFFIWYPYDPTASSLSYILTYLSHMHCSFFAGLVFVSADLLLISLVTQLCMHLDHIAQQLKQLDGSSLPEAESVRYLQQLVQYHAKCLELCEGLNRIFNFTLLLNFMTASLNICLVGFQMTAANGAEDIIKNIFFLLAALLQVFIICFCGEALMTASMSVGDAAFSMEWFDCSERFKKMLISVIARSQKAAQIRPPTLPPISFNTYMKIIGMAYRFFTLLRTMYFDN